MKLREACKAGEKILSEAQIETAALDAAVLLQQVLQKDRTFLIMNPDYSLNEDEERKYNDRIEQRASGRPVSYIIGEKEFMGLPFEVNEGVLIPRPDTEILVETAIDWLTERSNGFVQPKLRALDICTGSGAIAVSMAYYNEATEVQACDISTAALAVAQRNAVKNGVGDRVELFQGDLFSALPRESMDEGWDLIASNPPYIRTDVIPGLMKDVKDFEPMLALDGGGDGLDFYRRIIPEAAGRLRGGGLLLLEIGHDQAAAVTGLLKTHGGYEKIRVIPDLAGLDRVVAAEKRPAS